MHRCAGATDAAFAALLANLSVAILHRRQIIQGSPQLNADMPMGILVSARPHAC